MAARSASGRCVTPALPIWRPAVSPPEYSWQKGQFDAAQNMTDVLAALGVLSAVDAPERTAALQAFYNAWRGDPLVLDKWFSIQAFSPRPDTVAAVEALMTHPDFDLRNPNRGARPRWCLRRQPGALPCRLRIRVSSLCRHDHPARSIQPASRRPHGLAARPMAPLRRSAPVADAGRVAAYPGAADIVAEYARNGIEERRIEEWS